MPSAKRAMSVDDQTRRVFSIFKSQTLRMTQRHYSAFISYSHADEAFATKLHSFLESWRTPRKLVGKPNRDGGVPKRLFPVFRDRNELPTSADLGAVIRDGLANSRYLIVLCSPRSAKSRWVNEEILEFKRLHGKGRVIAAILEGDPSEAFPPALQYAMGADGQLTDTPVEPVAADFRAGKDGRQNGRLKLVAGLLGVNFDDLFQREKRRRATRINIGIVGLGALAIAAAIGFSQLVSWFLVSGDKTTMRGAISDLNQGEYLLGAEAVLRGDPHRERWIEDAHRDLDRALRARLKPLDDAVRDVAFGEVRRWRETTLLRVPRTMLGLPASDFVAGVEGVALLLAKGPDVTAVSFDDGETLWKASLTGDERLCNIWQSSETPNLLAEGYAIGVNGAQSYGFASYLDPQTGDLQRIAGDLAIGAQVCTDGPSQQVFDGQAFNRISRDIPAFQWPQQIPERRLWERQPTPARAPFVSADQANALLDRAGLNSDERASAQVAQCETRSVISFTTTEGFGMCRGAENLMCMRLATDHQITGTAISPACEMIVGWGDTQADRPGLSILLADGTQGRVAQAVSARSLALGTFSANGAYFAASHDDDTLLIFETTPSGLVLMQTYAFSKPLSALAFLGDDSILALRSDGRLYTLDRETGKDLRPYINLGPEIAQISVDPAGAEGERLLHLVADPSGQYFALLVQVGASTAAALDPNLTVPGAGTVRYARVFDNRLGVAFGGRLVLNELYAPSAAVDPWGGARLDVTEAGMLHFTAVDGQTLGLVGGTASDAYAKDLTGVSFGDAVDTLPSVWLLDE